MLYNVFSYFAWFALQCGTPFSKKLKEFISGRKSRNSVNEKNAIWFHCASVGEFEQARPLIEKIKTSNPFEKILVSFFSPSGFNHYQNFELADDICYAPFDTPKQVNDFLNVHQPRALILVKYEFWKNMIRGCHSQDIPVYSVASIFRENQRFFGVFQGFFKSDLKRIKHFFVQNTSSEKLLSKIGISSVSVIGDTRFDRVIEIAEKSQKIESIRSFCQGANILVAGSTWPTDEKLLEKCYSELKNWKIIIAPHDVQSSRIKDILKTFDMHQPVVYSGAKSEEIKNSKALIIDSIGMLNRVYSESDVCYVGGAFGAGLHNILEAAVYGKPVIHGPRIEKFQEAKDLLEKGGSFCISTLEQDKDSVLEIFNNEEIRSRMGEIAKNYVYENLGASVKVISHLKKDGIF